MGLSSAVTVENCGSRVRVAVVKVHFASRLAIEGEGEHLDSFMDVIDLAGKLILNRVKVEVHMRSTIEK